MKTLLPLTILLLLFSCQKKDKKIATSVKGSVLQDGTLKPLAPENLYAFIYEGNSRIRTVEIVNGKYSAEFQAREDRSHTMIIRDLSTNNIIARYPIYPGDSQVRDIILPIMATLEINLNETQRFAGKFEVSLVADFFTEKVIIDGSQQYQEYLQWESGNDLLLQVSVFTTGQRHNIYKYLNIPYRDTLKVDIDI